MSAAFEVPLRACTPWCEAGDGHANEHSDDRYCWSSFQVIPMRSAPARADV